MHEGRRSTTAERVALRRAAHQLLDAPLVFDDPVALRIIGEAQAHMLRADAQQDASLIATRVRAFMVARSRYRLAGVAEPDRTPRVRCHSRDRPRGG